MADQTYSITIPDMHQGPGFFWPVLLAPADGARMLVDGSGNPINPAATSWASATPYVAGQQVWDGTNIEVCVLGGTSGSTAPSWSTTPYPASSLSSAAVAEGSGKPTWACIGPPYSAGATDGAAEFTATSKLEEVSIDQETGVVDAIMTAQSAELDVTFKESSLRKIWYAIAGGLFSSGTDTALPTGAQAYEQLDFGGLELPNTLAPGVGWCCGIISPRRGYSSPGKYMVAVLYNAYPKAALKLPFTKAKESMYKVTFAGMAQIWRTQGKRIAQFYRQT
jgi:hypothetical protein